MGKARLVFDALEPVEMSVIDEFLFTTLYLIEARADTVIDCGAFRGISTIYLSDQARAGTVIAFEPQKDNCAFLVQRVKQRLPDAVCRNEAVGNENSTVCFAGDRGRRLGRHGWRRDRANPARRFAGDRCIPVAFVKDGRRGCGAMDTAGASDCSS